MEQQHPSPDSDLPPLAAIKVRSSPPRFPHPTTPLSTETPTSNAQRKIGIAVDLSDESAFAVKWSVHHYLRPGDAVILVHVRPTSVLYGADWGSVDLSVFDTENEESQRKLEDDFDTFTTSKASDLAQPLVNAQIPFKIHIVKDHDMRERLCLEAERLGLSAMIMGSRGFGATKRGSDGRLGSVSDYCVRHCACPVVVVRYPDEKDSTGGTAKPVVSVSSAADDEEPEYHDASDDRKVIIIQSFSGAAQDTINTTQTIRDGQSIVSSGGTFELGFFSPGTSSNRYLGMWFKTVSIQTVVWVANRQAPLENRTGVLTLTETGILVLLNDTNGSMIWSSNSSSRSVRNPVAQLLDHGNLVIREVGDDSDENYVWQSFDYPTDTFLPGMKFGRNYVTGLNWSLTSWKSNEDPAPGEYTHVLDPTGYPQIYTTTRTGIHVRSGPWIGVRFSGSNTVDDQTYNVTMVMNQNELLYQLEAVDTSVISRLSSINLTAYTYTQHPKQAQSTFQGTLKSSVKFVGLILMSLIYWFTLNQNGVAQRLVWLTRTQEWRVYTNLPADNCDNYNLCGAYGICNIVRSPACTCLDRFEPRVPAVWLGGDWTSSGCVRRANLSCGGDGFVRYPGVKLPEARQARPRENLTLDQCRDECLRNCSCMAHSQLDLSKRNGCLQWFGELLDIRQMSQDGQDLYIRLAASEFDSKGKKRGILIGSLSSGIAVALLLLGLFLYIRRRKKGPQINEGNEGKGNGTSNHEYSDLPLFRYSDILKATDDFSWHNKLGEGGFGPVYKGTLEDGQEIAVKCLSSKSTQGIVEFKNEVIFIAKLQHRNLVRLLGCCIHQQESLLVYEYMPHKGLDGILFNETRKALLDWPKRFHIINGIARGLIYLHQDSRLRIIHRDLKASNILFDSELNPKISDFGTARSFGGNEVEAKTGRVVGTYGYMSPEYIVDGLFSIKSDVFSFGVLVLEIVSGKRNRGFSHSDHQLNLLGHAWTLYKEERLSELVDPSLAGTYDIWEVERSIHIGLLCVQKKPEDRPEMSTVVLMLGSDGALPKANQPGFFTEREGFGQSTNSTTISTKEITITMPDGR